jgi:hypothetical protein
MHIFNYLFICTYLIFKISYNYTDVIHYETRKLVYYHGNLTHFVEIHPEARYYYELESSTLVFKFPVPER